jgi:hypothetical protein
MRAEDSKLGIGEVRWVLLLPDANSSQLVCLPPPLDGFQNYTIPLHDISTHFVPGFSVQFS